MKIAVGIIALVLSLPLFMQSCALTGLSSLADEKNMMDGGSIGILMGFLMFLGGAFSFGLPKVAQIIFGLVFFLSLVATSGFPDAQIWGYVALALGVLMAFSSGGIFERKKD